MKAQKPTNYILKYYQQIRDGSVVVGKWVDLVYSYLVSGLEKGSFKFDQRKADRQKKDMGIA